MWYDGRNCEVKAMNIVKAEACHISGILNLLGQVGQVHHEIRPDIFRDGALKYDETALKALLLEENKPIFIAQEDDRVLGYCFCVLKDYRGSGVQTDRVELYIDDLCVEEAARGQGIATALYRYVKDFAKELGCSHVTLNVWCGNVGAQRFYEKMGPMPRHIMMEQPLEGN
jgi:ribosomal protein S18 acetylase RimI-like enzyme